MFLIFVIIVILAVWFVSSRNRIKAAELKVKEADSDIDVALTKRYDVLTKQLAAVKGYISYESRTLFQTIRLRMGMPVRDKMEMSDKMDAVSAQIKYTAEQYPELRSSANFLQLQNSIMEVEEHLQAARRLYNSNVTAYNTKIAMFPTSIVAALIGAKSKDLFEAETHKRNDVDISF